MARSAIQPFSACQNGLPNSSATRRPTRFDLASWELAAPITLSASCSSGDRHFASDWKSGALGLDKTLGRRRDKLDAGVGGTFNRRPAEKGKQGADDQKRLCASAVKSADYSRILLGRP